VRFFVAEGALAQTKDAPGSKDHPMIKRFEGSAIIGYEFKKFNDLVILLGPVRGEYSPFLKGEYEMERNKSPVTPTKSQTVEGQSTRISMASSLCSSAHAISAASRMVHWAGCTCTPQASAPERSREARIREIAALRLVDREVAEDDEPIRMLPRGSMASSFAFGSHGVCGVSTAASTPPASTSLSAAALV
jgi:hypothetical protein